MRRRLLASVGGAHKLTAKDYVQDGLITLFDGIENAGYGIHDDVASQWIDLKSSRNAVRFTSEQIEWGSNCIVCDESLPVLRSQIPVMNQSWSVEVFCKPKFGYFSNYHGVVGGCNRDPGISLIFCQYENGNLRIGNYGGSVSSTDCFSVGGFSSKDKWPNSSLVFTQGVSTTISLLVDKTELRAKLYKDAVILNDAGDVVTSSNSNITTGLFYIGVGDYSTGLTNRRFVGNIYCIRIYNRSLSFSELRKNHSIDVSRFE